MTSSQMLTSSNRTQSSIIGERLRRDIVSGLLAPGSKLKITEIAARYEVGVIPTREALARLSSLGLVIAEDQRGYRVSPTSADELTELSVLRRNLEAQALTESIFAGDISWETALVAAHHRLERLVERRNPDALGFDEAWDEAHVGFHRALLAACRSQWLMHFVEVLGEQMNRYRHLSTGFVAGGRRNIAAEHQALLDAALERDAGRAVKILQEHFSRTEENALKAINQQES